MKIEKKIEENIKAIDNVLGIDESFDVILREIIIAGKKAALLFVDGFAKDGVMLKLLQSLFLNLKRDDIVPNTIEKLIKEKIGYIEVESVETIEEIIDNVLAGPIAMLVEGETKAIIIDAREYPVRNPEEPDIERVTRGSRDGMVETIVFNTALIRRRIRDPKLRNEIFKVGVRSKTDVVVSYIKDIANPELVNLVKEKIKNVKTDALVMGEKTLEEFIIGKNWNPLPKARYTERPDVVAAHLLEGHIAIIVDTTPSVMVLPATLFHFTQHAEDYFQNPLVGTYLRWIRFLAILVSFVLPPLWLTLVYYKAQLSPWLEFLGPKQSGNVPLFIQFVVLEIGIDLIRTALIHTPNALATSLGLLGAILLGEFAVKVGLFSPEAILYMAVTAIGSFATPSIEFALAIRLFRFFILILTGLFRLPGLLTGIVISLIIMAKTKSFGNIPYLWPFMPLNLKALMTIVFRKPIPEVSKRPEILKPIDRDEPKKKG